MAEQQITEPRLTPIDTTGLRAARDAVTRMRRECGTTTPELVSERLDDARTELIEAMKLADPGEDGGNYSLHVCVANIVAHVDELQATISGGAWS